MDRWRRVTMRRCRSPQEVFAMGLEILITNYSLTEHSGTTVYVRDLALELRRQGHHPSVYTLSMGAVAEDLRAAGIPISTWLGNVARHVDVIHGHHFHGTLHAIQRLPGVPAIYVCHDHLSPYDRIPHHPRIHRYFGVSRLCLERLRREGIADHNLELLFNFVDTARLPPRAPLPERPRRALMFSNYAQDFTYLPLVKQACAAAGLELDVSADFHRELRSKPDRYLGHYDIVFAKAKCALDAMAVGTAVILCDFAGAGSMVTVSQLPALRPLNFGFEALCNPLTPEVLLREIQRYDRDEAARVRDAVRSMASLPLAARSLVDIYQGAMHAEQGYGRANRDPPRRRIPIARLKMLQWFIGCWRKLPAAWRAFARRQAGWRAIQTKLWAQVSRLPS
jgi:hypothetical protein